MTSFLNRDCLVQILPYLDPESFSLFISMGFLGSSEILPRTQNYLACHGIINPMDFFINKFIPIDFAPHSHSSDMVKEVNERMIKYRDPVPFSLLRGEKIREYVLTFIKTIIKEERLILLAEKVILSLSGDQGKIQALIDFTVKEEIIEVNPITLELALKPSLAPRKFLPYILTALAESNNEEMIDYYFSLGSKCIFDPNNISSCQNSCLFYTYARKGDLKMFDKYISKIYSVEKEIYPEGGQMRLNSANHILQLCMVLSIKYDHLNVFKWCRKALVRENPNFNVNLPDHLISLARDLGREEFNRYFVDNY